VTSPRRFRLDARVIVGTALVCGAALLVIPGRATPVVPASPKAIYWTSEKLEPDTMASAWLLTRFAAPGCEIQLLPRGQRSEVGTPFDVPLVPFSRDRTRSTYEVIRAETRLDDVRLRSIGELVDEVEIGSWSALPSERAAAFEARLRACVAEAPAPAAALEAGYRVFDEMYAMAPAN
jgi:hypothetical protein